MFRSFSNQLAAANAGNNAQKFLSPTLRSDIYRLLDQVKTWISGQKGSGRPGDGVSYSAILSVIQNHFPDLKVGMDSLGRAEDETAIIVGGVTNMVLEMSSWEGMGGAMAMKTWTDAIVAAYARAEGSHKDAIARGIIKGINQNTDMTLMTKEFTAKIQLISCLKSLSSRIYGAGSDEARQAEASLSSKFI